MKSPFTPILIAAALGFSAAASGAPQTTPTDASTWAQDFNVFWQFVDTDYAYFDQRRTDWAKVRDRYAPKAAVVAKRSDFIAVLEASLGELYDSHAHLGTNTATSPRLTPTDADLWAEWRGADAVITDVRVDSAAERVGVRAGMLVLAVGAEPVAQATRHREPQTLSAPDPRARDWALRAALAGTRDAPVRLTLAQATPGAASLHVQFVPGVSRPSAPLSLSRDGHVAHLRINNTLGDMALIGAFDAAIEQLSDARALILDLRDTPSGGTTTVARAIMGRLLSKEAPYQRHELVSEQRETGIKRSWVEYVTPRGAAPYRGAVVVLVGRWTGSMGEGIAIGLHGAGRARVVGTPMAGLLGAMGQTTLPASNITVRIPTEKLFHVNGTSREDFRPEPLMLADQAPPGQDTALEATLALIRAAPGFR